MKNLVTITNVIDALKDRGFEFIGKTDSGWFKLRGLLVPPTLEEGCPCELYLDPQLFELPSIRLLKIPSELPAAIPHLSGDGELCYIAKGTIVLDIFDPIGQSLACLDRATEVLDQIMNKEMVGDLEEEFFAYWGGLFCMFDIQEGGMGRHNCIVAKIKERSSWFITDNVERTTMKLTSLGYEVTDKTVLTYRVKTKAQPRPLTNNWPPRTVQDVLNWQGVLDKRCRRKILQRIQEGEKNKANGVLIIVESPLMTYGFAVFYNRADRPLETKLTAHQNNIYDLEVLPMTVVRIDDNYIAQRNIPTLKTLAGKKIAIVGSGTIGGYLSEMLVKAGAGTSGGKLTLVDFDSLFPQNIGRHRLGFPDLFSNKATAMVNELKRLAPGVSARALPVDVKQASLGDLDLLIDTSGEEALGHWLCSNYIPHTPMLSVWIEGTGTAVRALLKKYNSHACYRCIWHSNKKSELRSTVDPLPIILAGHGCEGLYVPFPASVSVHAASLGAEMVIDWVNGIYSPSLRTRLIDHTQQLATHDCDPLVHQDCPVCNS